MFRHTRNGDIRINDVVYDLDDVLAAVPDYKLPDGMSHSEVDDNPRVFDENGNQYKSPDVYTSFALAALASIATIDAAKISRVLAEAASKADADQTKYDALSVQEKRRIEYDNRGVTYTEMTVAIWESVVEGRPQKADALQLVRLVVKSDIPKA